MHRPMVLVVNLLSVLFGAYTCYQQAYYHGDGFGNLPTDAPEWIQSVKHSLCVTVSLSPWVVGIWLGLSVTSIVYASGWRAAALGLLTVLTLLLYAFSLFVFGSYICW
ncbi:hypothetical protein B0919_11060 [Hymenobacter sp. CRA2]|nr:hypothetical protein B0919_11060 [Hymenobacter sp. CRA2]